MTDKSRTTQAFPEEFDIESIASEIQRGKFKSPSFFGDYSMTSGFTSFNKGVNAALNYSGASILKNDLVTSRNEGDTFRLTTSEFTLLQKRARSIAKYGNIHYDTAEDFLLILCFINKIEDMQKVSEAIDVPELNDQNILRHPTIILNLPNLEKSCYCASAIEGLVKLFQKYINSSQSVSNFDGESILDLLSSFGIGSASSFTHMIDGASPATLIGNFLSEKVTGKRIPMAVIAKNPNHQSPSYAGKAFFGESPTALSLIDINQVFNKKIGVFPKPSAGSGVTSFNLQNSKNFDNSMSITDLVSKMTFGSINSTLGSQKQTMIDNITSQMNSILGTTNDEVIDIRRADTAIPIMMSMSQISSGTEKSPFSADTFKQGWVNSNAVSNHLSQNSPAFIETVKRFL